MSKTVVLILVNVFLLTVSSNRRNKRFLIFPQSSPTRHQFIAGIGIPAELEEQSVTVGYVFKAQFYLPYTSSVWRTSPIVPEFREKRKVTDDNYEQWNLTNSQESAGKRIDSRWKVYRLLENVLERSGYAAQECLLLAICESTQINFETHHSILAEILHIILTPSKGHPNGSEDNLYLQAESVGKTMIRCKDKFPKCVSSFLDRISFIL